MQKDYTELGTVQLAHCEVIISSHERKGTTYLTLAPRKTFLDRESQKLVAFIPKRSSIEFASLEELDDLLETLIRLRDEGILS
jgi:hypothetical protein